MNGTLAYLSLKDGTVHERRAPDDLYVEGWTVEGRFHPEGHVQGDGVFAHDGEPGWLELADGRFYPATAARTPVAPYVRGYRDSDGLFRPSSRQVHY